MSDIEREEFEQAVADKWSDSYKFTRFGDEDYYDEVLEGMWWGWQASRQGVEGEPVAVVDRVGIMQRLPPYTNLPEGTKLYIHPASAVPDSEYVRALQDACDIIQADANTEENYASLCRIGAALVKLRAAPDKADEQVSVPERIKCSERMPSKEDADCDSAVWVSDCAFHRPKYAQKRVHWETVSEVAEYTHWKSTGLARPQPPKQEQGK